MNEIDAYLKNLDNITDKNTLERLRNEIRNILPNASECISYGMPAFRVDGKTVAGFAAFKNHLTFFPFSGSTLANMGDELKGWNYTKSGVHFSSEKEIPKHLLEMIIRKRLTEL